MICSKENKYFLGIDNGGTMSKAALFDAHGEELACASRPVETIEKHQNWSERDANKMWDQTADAIREVIHKSTVASAKISAIGCTGHGNGLYLVDNSGNPVRNAINSTDSRAVSYIKNWKSQGIDKKVLPFTSQCLWPAQPNALLSWIRDNEPENLAKTKWVMFAKDFIRTQLTGDICGEITDMSGSSLMNVITGDYDDSILETFGLTEIKSKLPPLKNSHDLCGYVTSKAAQQTGLNEGTPVVAGMFDIDACGLASGITNEGQMSMVAGTWGNNQYIAREPLIDEDLFMTSRYSIPGWYLMLEGSPTSASNLEWFVKSFFTSELELGRPVLKECDETILHIGPETNDIIFLPFLFGTNEKSAAESSFLGIQSHHTRADLLQAVYEGIVFSHYHHFRRLLQFRQKPSCIRFTGGAARSVVWAQMFSDCFQIPVEIPTGTELGSLGSAIAAAVGTGTYSSYEEAVEHMTSISRRHIPNSDRAEIYQRKYMRYKKAVSVLHDLWS